MIRAVIFDWGGYTRQPTYTITELSEIKNILS